MKFVPKELRNSSDISRGDHTWQSFLKNTLSAVITLGAVYLALGLLANLLAGFLPESWEARLFTGSPEDFGEPSPGLLEARAVLQHLLEDEDLRPLSYHLFVAEEKLPNAFAVPGGGIGLTTGLLENVKTDIGLATVLAHELGHHQHRHILKRMGRGILHRFVSAVLFGGDGNNFLETSLAVGETRYSRAQEIEADEFALRLVHRRFDQTEGCLEFFELIREDSGEDGLRWTAFLATHPLTEERIARLRQLQEDLASSREP